MIDRIEMYKVGFGDCFICSDKNNRYKMLIDCGKFRGSLSANIVQEINNSLSNSTNYLMVTHFHNDHFSGLKKLDKNLNFERIYLPNFITENILTLEFAMLANKSISGDEKYQTALNLITSIPTIARHFVRGTRISFLNRKYGIASKTTNGLDSFRILWPDMSYTEAYAKELREVLKAEITDDSYNILKEYANKYIHLISSRSDNGIFYASNGENNNQEDETIMAFERLIEDFIRSVHLDLPERLLRKFSRIQNNISLCFDNVSSHNSSPVLFLSDIPKNEYKKIVKTTDLSDYYYAIKVPHHGTAKYFIDNLPESRYLFITNDNSHIVTNLMCCDLQCARPRCCFPIGYDICYFNL